MFSFACKHKTLTKIKEDGRQYCAVCNMAFVPDCPHVWELFGKDKQKCKHCGELRKIDEGPCRHKWSEYGRSEKKNTITNFVVGYMIILKCDKCGELKEFQIGV